MRLIHSTYLEDEAINQTGVGYWGESLHKTPRTPDICRQGFCAGHCAQGFRGAFTELCQQLGQVGTTLAPI